MNALTAIQVFFLLLAVVMAESGEGELKSGDESLGMSGADILKDYDTNKDGKISFAEVPYVGDTEEHQKKLEASFHKADADGDGLLSAEELPVMVKLTTEEEQPENHEEREDRFDGDPEQVVSRQQEDREGGEEREGSEEGEGGEEGEESDREEGEGGEEGEDREGGEDGKRGDKKEPIKTTDDHEEIMDMHDADKDGKLSWTEVLEAIHWESAHHNTLVEEAFGDSDLNDDKHLNMDEVKHMVQTLKRIKDNGRHLESGQSEEQEPQEEPHFDPRTADGIDLNEHHGYAGGDDDPHVVLVKFDLNKDNKLGWDEMLESFVMADDGKPHPREHQDLVQAAFKKADNNHDAFVDEYEIEDFVELMQNADSAQEIEDDLVERSSHKDGTRDVRHHLDRIGVDDYGPADHLHEL